MACTTFHLFTRLPNELRFMIWENACLEQRRGYRAIHYMTAQTDRCVTPSKHTWDDSNYNKKKSHNSKKKKEPKSKNNSVYLWHAGLWMACSESREVVFQN
ncbi:unnamed protein product [Fusarium venenatum]|uniref:2EXR domain-containing protein n=1 Tax=Fusarium venenatum TaxID=56646 RepID=A0A2L2TH16_9HYPO|nr:uncharacterized protein FVRRES_10341 [Fusarium venenatum]KAH6966955.1 hypothetical protein EDB82DRAFT_481249 [Fusarium venenatum]CEI70264.1 unnamed protein product [Fusarium venenatum]